MATLIYDGREYPIDHDDVQKVIDAVKHSVVVEPGWMAIGSAAGVVHLYVSSGVNIAIVRTVFSRRLVSSLLGLSGRCRHALDHQKPRLIVTENVTRR